LFRHIHSFIRYEIGSCRQTEILSIRHGQSAADAQHLPGDVVGSSAQKEQDGLRDFYRFCDPTERNIASGKTKRVRTAVNFEADNTARA
jgi:hypothetical protein